MWGYVVKINDKVFDFSFVVINHMRVRVRVRACVQAVSTALCYIYFFMIFENYLVSSF